MKNYNVNFYGNEKNFSAQCWVCPDQQDGCVNVLIRRYRTMKLDSIEGLYASENMAWCKRMRSDTSPFYTNKYRNKYSELDKN